MKNFGKVILSLVLGIGVAALLIFVFYITIGNNNTFQHSSIKDIGDFIAGCVLIILLAMIAALTGGRLFLAFDIISLFIVAIFTAVDFNITVAIYFFLIFAVFLFLTAAVVGADPVKFQYYNVKAEGFEKLYGWFYFCFAVVFLIGVVKMNAFLKLL